MRHARVRRVTLALALLATAGGVAASPVGAVHSDTRPPTSRERAILIQIVRAYVESTCCDGIKRIKIDFVILSTADPRWAEVGLQAWDKQLTYLGGDAAVLHRGGRTGKWSLRYFGAAGVVCDAPPRVRRDLQLTCP
jgi:hypothetical protein